MNEHPKQAEILKHFNALNTVPRQSKHEERVQAWLKAWAESKGLTTRSDAVGNLIVCVPGRGSKVTTPVAIQGHTDMVCEKRPDVVHDFSRDPIRSVIKGEWLHAEGTTLGADNGIAVAMAMTLAEDDSLVHPPLELVFTIDEETGLTGANALDPDLLTSRILINLDSEDEGVFTVGCAGGVDTHLRRKFPCDASMSTQILLTLGMAGFSGGHSGVDIHEQRGNAIHALARVMQKVLAHPGWMLSSLAGGSAHNAIPREATALLVCACDEATLAAIHESCIALSEDIAQEFSQTDPGVRFEWNVEPLGAPLEVLSETDSRAVNDLLLALPHGVAAMDAHVEGLVETSSNLARVALSKGELEIITSQRSSVPSRLLVITECIEAAGRLADCDISRGDGYPPWPPVWDAPLLAECRAAYEALTGKQPIVEVIHAGLECGVIGAKIPGMQMVSMGPTICNPHSPDERLHLPSVGRTWDLLLGILRRLAQG